MSKTTYQIILVGGYLLLLFALVIAGNALAAEAYTTFVTIMLSILIEAIPFLLAGALVSGLIHVFLDQQILFRVVPRHPLAGALLGSVCGLLFPVCECGVIPVTRRLYQKGLPLSMGIAFMLAAPVVNPIVIASTYAAFGWSPMLFARLGVCVLVASAVGLIFSAAQPHEVLIADSRTSHAHQPGYLASVTEKAECAHPDAQIPVSRNVRMHEALAIAGDDFLDMIRYVIAGSIIAAGLQTLVPQTVFLQLRTNMITAILTMMLLAFVMSVCSTADAFLALAFTNIFSPAAVLAFLVFGPMIDIKSTLMLLRVFRRHSILYIFLLAGMMTLTVGAFLTFQEGW